MGGKNLDPSGKMTRTPPDGQGAEAADHSDLAFDFCDSLFDALGFLDDPSVPLPAWPEDGAAAVSVALSVALSVSSGVPKGSLPFFSPWRDMSSTSPPTGGLLVSTLGV